MEKFTKEEKELLEQNPNIQAVLSNQVLYTKDFKEKHCDSIKGEFKSNGVNNELKHTEGVLSMARTMIKDSASSQFFIMHKPAPHLDGEYAAFGKITEGLDIVDQIANVPTNFQDCPTTPVVIKTIRRA